MDQDLTCTPTVAVGPDDTEIDTPLQTHTNHHRPPPPPEPAYKECMKNHAATIGGHAVDGCGEYMPANSASPASLTCAACGCHRNFHRREATAITPPFLDFRPPPQTKRTSCSLSSPRHPPFPYSSAPPPHMLLTLSTAAKHHQEPVRPATENPGGRKHFRTKFSDEHKETIQSFSEKIGWKMQKSDEAAVEEFRREVEVSKGVLKVWMHNNKTMFGRKETINSKNNINEGMISCVNNIIGGNGDSKDEEIR